MMKKIFGRLRSKKKQKDEEEKKQKDVLRYVESLDRYDSKTMKWLILGIGGSGKSTILKQLTKIYTGSISDEAKKATYKIKQNILDDIYDLCIQNMICLLIIKQLYSNLFIPSEIINMISTFFYGHSIGLSKESQIICQEIVSLKNSNSKNVELTPDLATKISILWNDKGLQETFNFRKRQRIMDNTPYFFENINKISQLEYIANTDDYMRVRNSTIGIIEQQFDIAVDHNEDNNWKVEITDVGGHREERKNWSKCFGDIYTIFYVMALDGYDKTLLEDDTQNCYREALDVFEKTMKHEALAIVDAIVFLNKNDLFITKIKEIPFSVFEPNFNKDLVHNEKAVKQYLFDEYKKRFYNGIKAEKSPRRIHFHVTCATDTNSNQIQRVMTIIQFETVRKICRVGMLM